MGEANRPVAQAGPDKKPENPGAKKKKRRNGDAEEEAPPPRSYAELLKKPTTLGFKPSESYFNNVGYHIRNSFVESVSDEQLVTGAKKEVANLLSQAKISDAGLKAIPNATPLKRGAAPPGDGAHALAQAAPAGARRVLQLLHRARADPARGEVPPRAGKLVSSFGFSSSRR